MTAYLLTSGQSVSINGNGTSNNTLGFAGQGALGAPIATMIGSSTMAAITDTGTAPSAGQQAGYGNINLAYGSALTTNSLSVARATLSINEMSHSSVVLNGTSTIADGGILMAAGYRGFSNYVLNGSMSIDGTSTVNFSPVTLKGPGTFHLSGSNAALWLGSTDAGPTVQLDAGMLKLTNAMSFLGTITDSTPAASRIGDGASVDVYYAMQAATETFDSTTGVLSLLDAAGSHLAALHFAGTGNLYVAPVSNPNGNYLAITSHASASDLPVTFTS